MLKFYLNHAVCICFCLLMASHTAYCPPKKGSKQVAAAAACSEPTAVAEKPLSPRSPQRLPACPAAAAAVAAATVLRASPTAATTEDSAVATTAAAQPTDLITLDDGRTVTRAELYTEYTDNGWDVCEGWKDYADRVVALMKTAQPSSEQSWITAIMTLPADWVSRYIHDEYRTERARRMLGTSPATILCEKIAEGTLDGFLMYLNTQSPRDGYHWLEAGLVRAMDEKQTSQFQQLVQASIRYRTHLSTETIFDIRQYLKNKAAANSTDLEEAIAEHCAVQQELQKIANEIAGVVAPLHSPEEIAEYAKAQAQAITKRGSNNYYPRDRSPSPDSRGAAAARATK